MFDGWTIATEAVRVLLHVVEVATVKQAGNTTRSCVGKPLSDSLQARFKKDCRLMDYDDPPYTTEMKGQVKAKNPGPNHEPTMGVEQPLFIAT